MRFWTWLKKFAECKERQCWVETRFSDQLCPHCKTWQGNCGGLAGSVQVDQMHDRLTCGKCGKDSTWFIGAPVLILVDPKEAA